MLKYHEETYIIFNYINKSGTMTNRVKMSKKQGKIAHAVAGNETIS